ncbi:hypothetical protein ODJ79_14300 [Actinoplanes sp. KI2]|uniref:hypothetical protein n=1 Tax=Actinoplanes sp. KI2 TaxID=2983315 RepID=UPI0021D613E3|nr:hypothetical protein [Actinoplanes sp. KI2]MCU7724894.1 hypothetical protein [Actinoplanes sp. KI2]
MANIRKTLAAVVAAIAVVAGAGGCGTGSRPDDGSVVVDPSVQDHDLLDDVLAIDAKRETGGSGFSYVPRTRPDGLHRLTTNTAESRIVDGYQLGAERVQVMAEFAAQPTGTCASMKADPGSGVCVWAGPVKAAANDPKLRNLTVYVSQVGVQPTIPDDAVTRRVRTFWATADMVPVAAASWFTELVARAKAAPKVKLG